MQQRTSAPRSGFALRAIHRSARESDFPQGQDACSMRRIVLSLAGVSENNALSKSTISSVL